MGAERLPGAGLQKGASTSSRAGAAQEQGLSEEARAEEGLGEESLFREMANGLPLIVWVHDAAGDQVMVNDTFCEFFGVTREEMKGGHWQMLMHPEDAEPYTKEFFACVRDRVPFHAEVRVKRADGQWRWIESWARPRFSKSGDYRGFVGTSADVTEKKQAVERLRESDRRKNDYLAMLGHELRNPLAAIQNATEVVKLSKPGEANLNRAAAVLARQAAHMSGLVEGLLELSRIARGKITLDRQALDVRQVLAGVIEDRNAEIAACGLELHEDVGSEPMWVLCDRVRIAQVFDNLLGNALKFTPTPGSITIVLQQENDHAVVSIRDTGIGIRPATLLEIFAPFHQEDQDVKAGDGGLGLGLGLAVAKTLVELHDGTVEARSAGLGLGAEFLLRLPLTAERPDPSGTERAIAVAPRNVLIVEDNTDAAQMLGELLLLQGHEVTIAETGRQALELLHRHAQDVVLSDIGLPEMSGYELARAIRAEASLCEIWLVALTGHGQPEDRKQAAAAGFDEHLTKPVNLLQLNEIFLRLPCKSR